MKDSSLNHSRKRGRVPRKEKENIEKRDRNNEEAKEAISRFGVVPDPDARDIIGEEGANLKEVFDRRCKRVPALPQQQMVQGNTTLVETNKKILTELVEYLNWGACDSSDPDVMMERADRYLKYCLEHGRPVTNRGMYMAINLSKGQLDRYAQDRSNPRRSSCAKLIQKICAFYRETLAAEGKLSPILTIWWQKNYDGMKDQTDVRVSVDNPLGNLMDAEQLREKYIKSAGGEAFDCESDPNGSF